MFSGCENIINLNLSNITVNNGTNMSYMFRDCFNLTLDCSIWNGKVDKVTDYSFFNYNAPNVTPPDFSSKE